MFDAGPRKLKCGTEAVQGLTFASLKSPVPHCFTPVPHPLQRAALQQQKGRGGTDWELLLGSSRGFQAQLA